MLEEWGPPWAWRLHYRDYELERAATRPAEAPQVMGFRTFEGNPLVQDIPEDLELFLIPGMSHTTWVIPQAIFRSETPSDDGTDIDSDEEWMGKCAVVGVDPSTADSDETRRAARARVHSSRNAGPAIWESGEQCIVSESRTQRARARVHRLREQGTGETEEGGSGGPHPAEMDDSSGGPPSPPVAESPGRRVPRRLEALLRVPRSQLVEESLLRWSPPRSQLVEESSEAPDGPPGSGPTPRLLGCDLTVANIRWRAPGLWQLSSTPPEHLGGISKAPI